MESMVNYSTYLVIFFSMAQAKVTGLSGHEIYCLNKISCEAGNLLVGNSVQSLGAIRSLTSSLKAIAG